MIIDTQIPDSGAGAAMVLDRSESGCSELQIGTIIAVSDLGHLRILTHGIAKGDAHHYQAELVGRCASGQGAGETFWIEPFGLVRIV